MNWNVLRAIFKRNFVSYFSNPTGYVFICVFVLLSALAAFWPNEFFNANLANLDQLNQYLPYIMLVFIPAITMSIWAEERRQGTDELLLTIPAGDTEVVLGKFLAAVAIFSAALAFSMFSNYCVLGVLGRPDMGLFVGTYIGYWAVGLAMLSIGMVASFLTANLTVGYVLGAVFNAPLAFSARAEVIIPDPMVAQRVHQWSLQEQFRDFERGVLSLSSLSYFVMVTAVMLYLAVVLIGRRHWLGGRDGRSMLGHYAVRTLSLGALALGVTWFFAGHDARLDITSEQLSSLSPDTRRLIRELETEFPVKIEAYVSPRVPSEYVTTRLNLLAMLDEFASLGGGKIEVYKHIIENFSEEAKEAEEKYDIRPQEVASRTRGARTQEEVYLGVALTCGLEKVVVPFLDKGLSPEYELVRSIATVAQQKRKKLGVLQTDAQLFGTVDFHSMSTMGDQQIIDELRKQYEVVQVDPNSPLVERYDVLLAVQPSSLTPPQMDNFIHAVLSGQPTAIFEDPFPLPQFWGNVVGTEQPRRPQQNPMMMFQRQPPPEPKGQITRLWDALGVNLVGDEIVWQDYNPYRKWQSLIDPEWVFIDDGNGAKNPFNSKEPISAGLQQLLFMYPGAWEHQNSSKLQFAELAVTGDRTGKVNFDELMQVARRGDSMRLRREKTNQQYIIAARVWGKLDPPAPLAPSSDDDDSFGPGHDFSSREDGFGADITQVAFHDGDDHDHDHDHAHGHHHGADRKQGAKPSKEAASGSSQVDIDVVLVADIDCLGSPFFMLRQRGHEQDDEVRWDMDNVTFVLNTIDALAGDDRFIEIRKRRRPHRTLEKIEARTEEAKQRAAEEREKFFRDFETARDEAQAKFSERMAEIEKRTDLDALDRRIQSTMARQDAERRRDIRLRQLEQERDGKIKEIERDLALTVREVQDGYKLRAVLLPPIPPLVLAFFVFFHRRQQEREGVARSRLK